MPSEKSDSTSEEAYADAFAPGFPVPPFLLTDWCRLRPITIHDVVKDFDAVMSNRNYLWSIFGESWGWPPENLSLEADLIDLAWHQKEAQLRRTYNYAVMSLDEERLLGCVYIDPCEQEQFDAEIHYWLRQDGLGIGSEELLASIVKDWLADAWSFSAVVFPGREAK